MKQIVVFLVVISTILLLMFALSFIDFASKINQPNVEYEKEQYELKLKFKKRYNAATSFEKEQLFDSVFREELFFIDTSSIVKKYNGSLKDTINFDIKNTLFQIIQSDSESVGVSNQVLNQLRKEKVLNLTVLFTAKCSNDVSISMVSIWSNDIQLQLTLFVEPLERKMFISKAWFEEHPIHYEPFPTLTAKQSMKLSNLYFLKSIKENPYWGSFFRNNQPVNIGRNLNGLNTTIYRYRCQFKNDHPVKELKAYYW